MNEDILRFRLQFLVCRSLAAFLLIFVPGILLMVKDVLPSLHLGSLPVSFGTWCTVVVGTWWVVELVFLLVDAVRDVSSAIRALERTVSLHQAEATLKESFVQKRVREDIIKIMEKGGASELSKIRLYFGFPP